MVKEVNVLFLDDEENILKSINRLFLQEDFGVATTSEAELALQTIARENIKVVVSDYRMPNISGVEFLTKVKAAYPEKVRILFTGYADVEAAEEAVNVGEVFRFISKPWNGEELKDIIRKAIHHFDLVTEHRRLFEETQQKNVELEKMNQQLIFMRERQKEFTSTVSHELRTPLASMKMALDIVLSGSSGALTDEQKDFLTRAKNNVDRLNRMINDVLDISKLESGVIKVIKTLQPIEGVIKDSIDVQQPLAQEKGLKLEYMIDQDVPAFGFDKDKIMQVMSNLLTNALKFTAQGSVSVKVKNNSATNHISVCVEDTGEGIGQKDMGKLFQKFQQIQKSEKRVGGTGLGLAICHEIIKQHGGKIWAESEPGKGSKFCFNLPIEERRKA